MLFHLYNTWRKRLQNKQTPEHVSNMTGVLPQHLHSFLNKPTEKRFLFLWGKVRVRGRGFKLFNACLLYRPCYCVPHMNVTSPPIYFANKKKMKRLHLYRVRCDFTNTKSVLKSCGTRSSTDQTDALTSIPSAQRLKSPITSKSSWGFIPVF